MVNEINIGITGASGFIGKSLTSFFKNKRINVIVIKSRLNKIACPSGNCGSSSKYLI